MTKNPNQYIVVGEITHIILCDKEGNPVCSTIIDTKNLSKVSPYRWSYNGRYVGTATLGYHLRLHSLILGLKLGPDDYKESGLVSDHVNRNTLDNREVNLRRCSQSENVLNSERCEENDLPDYQRLKEELSSEEYKALLWLRSEGGQRLVKFISTL